MSRVADTAGKPISLLDSQIERRNLLHRRTLGWR